jgi:glycosyltransferase involved in cell wall biosynthesis
VVAHGRNGRVRPVGTRLAAQDADGVTLLGDVVRRIRTEIDVGRAQLAQGDISFFFTFVPPPYGGGNQFLQALWGECARRGYRLENNRISPVTRACLCNAFNFDVDRLRRFARKGCRIVHRVDGPVGVYRGVDDGTDRRIWSMNQEFADATVFQSQYSLERHEALGLSFKAPRVIHNASDPAIFHADGRQAFSRGRKTRLISTSWSDNSNKGADVYKWLEDRLDWDRFEYTFVGRSAVRFNRIRVVPPQPSRQLAELLRGHDILVTASLHESCSNAIVEALSCGLPVLYASSGGSPEIVGAAGFGFLGREEIPALLDRLVDELEERQSNIAPPRLDRVATLYLDAMGLPPARSGS